jgi:hypothetical protein
VKRDNTALESAARLVTVVFVTALRDECSVITCFVIY